MRYIVTELDLLDGLDTLPPRRKLAIQLRYGMGCEPHTLKATGLKLGVTTERARSLIYDAEQILFRFLRIRRAGPYTFLGNFRKKT